MKKLSLILILCLLLCGCSAPSKPSSGYTFTDDLGRQVSVDKPQRVAALLGSYADVWHLAGGTVCAAADDAWEDFDLELGDDAVRLGGTKSLSLEALLSAEPDFVLASTNTPQHLEWLPSLEKAGISVAFFDVSDFDDYLSMLKICTDITGMPENYTKYGLDSRARIDAILSRAPLYPPPTVLVLRASGVSIRAKNSEGTVLGTMLRDFGCINIADSDGSLLENLSVESIALMDPDIIFVIQIGADAQAAKDGVAALFAENPLWQQLSAVKNGRLYFMERRLFNMKPNARWAESYAILEEILYEAD